MQVHVKQTQCKETYLKPDSAVCVLVVKLKSGQTKHSTYIYPNTQIPYENGFDGNAIED